MCFVVQADLFHAYAAESERGITRVELFQLLQDHFPKRPLADASTVVYTTTARNSSTETRDIGDADARYFERLYTWLKKHVVVYDPSRCGCLSLSTALEMLRAHPSALRHLQLQVDPLIKKLQENDVKYQEKAAATQVQ